MTRWDYIENIATLCCTTALILGLYYLGCGLWSFAGLALLGNINDRRR